ncbi:MAG: MBL fold metallo-hydrolase [Ardenticatenaceae bacterium]|nr:MBL fold metallo-hydrolase [Ardenticatenaceae bacterium]MCB9443025.1 MBL fold metallo-hydrolase [Ardenticatenaceae bacterium]
MEITWYGLSCFRLTERKHATIVTDPYNGNLGLPQLKLKSDVVTISHDAQGHNCATAVSGKTHSLTGPGEYEIGNVFITGIVTNDNDDAKRNIIFMFDFDGVTVAHLGDITAVPKQTQIEALEQVNVLLVPVGSGNSLNAAQASELVSMLEPNIVIPMHYALPDLKLNLDGVDRFLKEMGVTDPTEETILKISKGNLPEETETVILVPKL